MRINEVEVKVKSNKGVEAKKEVELRLRDEWGWVTSTFWDIIPKGMVDGFPLVLEYTEYITHPGIIQSPIQSTTPLF